ncbi:AGE family epimerase/isomerase [Spirosoma endophyticum]|uniref:N-acylglucosamine 2-epimerase n=1 Tax=Spirosoma endophyticum TaxID=662367 RepID=A0A1I1V2W6_9BACT|nr:AGE family epimerase/isomerase [Spirosoma endophyticum]SFD77155.1 N-acylglucosamine 2-epimerase [Spirosoma endophyticum]
MHDFQKLSALYQQALLRQVVPFCLKHGRDDQYGGYFDSISAAGEVIDSDKSVDLQAQQAWAFAWLYNTVDGQPAWLEHARHGALFLSEFAQDATLHCYAQLDRRGRPVAAASDYIPDSFTIIAYAQLHRATGEDEWAMLAKQVFSNLRQRREADRAKQIDVLGGLRQLRHLSEPIAVLKAILEMQPLLDEETWKESRDSIIQELLHEFVDRRTDTLRESILPEGAFVNTPQGRRLAIGLIFQTASYLLDVYSESSDNRGGVLGNVNRKLASQVVAWCLQACEQAWDETGGGLNQYVDMKGQPVIFPDWQQKWAWVQVEAINALIKGYLYTRHPDCLRWFKRIHDYTFQHFPDPAQAGWQLVLDRQAQPLLTVKSLPSVGCFSLIRCLAETAQLLTQGDKIQPRERIGRSGLPISS